MPTPLVALPCGSASTRRVLRSAVAREAARFTAVVVLPTPPFWLAIAMTRVGIVRHCYTCSYIAWRLSGHQYSTYAHGTKAAFHVKRIAGSFTRNCNASAVVGLSHSAPTHRLHNEV